jgi:hypothetical protein
MTVVIPRPALGFPRPSWLARHDAYVEAAAREGLRLGARAPARPPEELRETERVIGTPFPEELRLLYATANRLRLGFVSVMPLERLPEEVPWVRGDTSPDEWAGCIPAGVPRRDLLAFADDACGNFYAYVLTPGAAHRVIYVCHDPCGAEHRFSTLATFLDAWMARAYASAAHEKIEREAGVPVDPKPWMDAARALEMEMDPAIVRTIDD